MKIELIGIIINSIIAISAIATLIYQRVFNSKSLNYSFHPVFKITEFCPNCTKYWTPKLCEASQPNSKHYCVDDHWFDITNDAPGYAFKFSCFLIHDKEINNDFNKSKFSSRIIKQEALIKNGKIQYKLPIDAIPFKYYNKSSTDSMYIIIEYNTVESRFRQVISLTIRPMKMNNQIQDWKSAIELNHPEVYSLSKIKWWQNYESTLKKELINIRDTTHNNGNR